ncbi:adenosylcobinamide-phosphate synthase CbiB [Methylosinus sp. Sm6]|uniref:adenosylcobinamide-phosphate synthase CbiB n=1 Tax=Methylosinus sp. Sm6 TaxID=2866948 RepID=UPI001C996161|nr:adenosylcobinamide-phosphate synthase CbiB [Methylosinus sp. Sm6]MBY6241635.1 adenosylcobinamide-phosphate synthase CbiB [Methylosinus sp. Sm6]
MSGLTLAALALEAAVGYPDRLHRRLPHPVVHVGAALSALERRWNRPERGESAKKIAGAATLFLVAGGAALAGAVAAHALGHGPLGASALALLATTGLAQRSLYDHVAAVRRALASGDLDAGREAVGRIVGRDVARLDAGDVAAAALESLAESFNDGVVAPAFWLTVGGLPGLFAYKAVNTADSMIGHKEPRWRSFGWASARADDLMNLAPSRLAGALIALAGGGWRVMLRDAGKHASPNAGWPEAAMAGALGLRLGGPASYDGAPVDRPQFGDGRRPQAHDLGRGLNLYVRACGLLWLLAAGAAWRWP